MRARYDGIEVILRDVQSGDHADTFALDGLHMHAGGEVCIVPAGERCFPPTGALGWILVVLLYPWLLHESALAMGLEIKRAVFPARFHLRDERLEPLLRAVRSEVQNPQPLGRFYTQSLSHAIAACVLERYRSGSIVMSSLAEQRIRRVLDYVEAHLAKDLSLDELAAVAGMSPSYFKATFKRTTGLSVHRYVIRRRVDFAATLITAKEEPLAQIACKAGFSDQSHMARWMRRLTGRTPAAFGSTCKQISMPRPQP